MNLKPLKIHIGLRTIKTAAAALIAMIIVDAYGATTSKLIFAMLGAMAAVQPTFTDSLTSCLTQIVGVLLGALAGILLLALRLPPMAAAGIGIVVVITTYNTLRIKYPPNLACLIVVILCTSDAPAPLFYAATRIWDTAIGMAVGMAINTLVFPYDNSNQLRILVESLDQEVVAFLEDLFDGDDHIPDAAKMTKTIDAMAKQLKIFSNQKLVLRLRRQQEELELFRSCDGMARELLARMEVLSRMGKPGRLNEENRLRLRACGADIPSGKPLKNPQERDMVTNYHVRQILSLRVDLLEALKQLKPLAGAKK